SSTRRIISPTAPVAPTNATLGNTSSILSRKRQGDRPHYNKRIAGRSARGRQDLTPQPPFLRGKGEADVLLPLPASGRGRGGGVDGPPHGPRVSGRPVRGRADRPVPVGAARLRHPRPRRPLHLPRPHRRGATAGRRRVFAPGPEDRPTAAHLRAAYRGPA